MKKFMACLLGLSCIISAPHAHAQKVEKRGVVIYVDDAKTSKL